MRWCLVSAAAFSLPAVALALCSGSMLLWSTLLDYAGAIVVGLIGWRILRASRTAREHGFDYGTGRLQTLGGVFGAGIYVALLLVFAWRVVLRLWAPVELNGPFTAAGATLQLANGAVDVWLWLRLRQLGRARPSPVLEMQWRAARADALSSFAVCLSVALSLALGNHAWARYLDPACALAFTIYAGVSFLPTLAAGFSELADKTLQEELQLRIDRRLAQTFHGYTAFHGVRSRRAGGIVFIEIGLSFAPETRVAEALETVGQLTRGIESDIPDSEVRVTLLPEDGRFS